jgi:hypothetical protein
VARVGYDVIVTDCTNIQYRSNGDLYTTEYFDLMKRRLAPGGLAAAWVPANGIGDADLKTLLRSFRAVFPHTSVWYMNSVATDWLIVVGSPDVLQIDLARLAKRMAVPAVHDDLASAGLADPYRLLYTFVAGEEGLADYLGAGELNTDDRPVLSYSTYGIGFRATIVPNLLRLLGCRSDVARFVRHPGPEAVMLRHYAASNELLLGHLSHLAGADSVALLHYARATDLVRGDPDIVALLRATYEAWEAREAGGGH